MHFSDRRTAERTLTIRSMDRQHSVVSNGTLVYVSAQAVGAQKISRLTVVDGGFMWRENGSGLRSPVTEKTLSGTTAGCATRRSGEVVSVADVSDVKMSLMEAGGRYLTRLTRDSDGSNMQMVWQFCG